MLVFKIAIFFLVFSSFCCLIGYITLGKKSIFNEFKKDLLLKLIFGSVVLVTTLSICITGFKTMYIAFLPLILYFIYYNRFFGTKISIEDKANNFLIVFIQMLFAVSLSYLIIKGDLINGQKALHLDQVFYGSLAESIWQTGLESVQSVYLDKELDIAIRPYHFFELWLTGFSINAFNVNSIFAIIGVVFTFHVFIFSMTIYVFFLDKIEKKQKFLLIIVSVIFFFTKGFLINPNYFSNEFNIILSDGCVKNIYPISFGLFSIFLFKEGKTRASFVFILITSLVNIVTFPAMIGGLLMYILLIFVFYKKDLAELVKDKYFIISVLLFFSLFAYYLFFISSSNQETGIQKSIGGSFFNILENSSIWLKEQFLLFTVSSIYLFKSKNDNFKKMYIFILSIAIAAIFLRAVLDNNQNSFQILNATKFIVNYAIILLFAIMLIDKYKKYVSYILYGIIILSVLHFYSGYKYFNHNFQSALCSYSSKYVNEINSIKIKNTIGIKVINAKNRPFLQKNPVYIGFCNYMPFIDNVSTSVVINIDSLLTRDKRGFAQNINREFINSSYFISKTNYKVGSGIESWNQSVLLYLKKLKPQFCIVDDGIELPVILEQFVSNKIIDKGTGEKFYLLNTSKM